MDDHILVRVDSARIDLLNRLVEAWDHIGVVSTLNQQEGRVIIRCTPDTRAELVEVLRHMPFEVELTDY